MERKLLERMVGAAALVLALVILVPALLDGNGSSRGGSEPSSGPEEAPMRTVTLEARGLNAARASPAPAARPEPAVSTAPAVVAPSSPAPPPAVAPAPAPSAPAPAAASAPPAAVAAPAPRPAAPAAAPKVTAEARHAERPPVAGSGWAVQLGVFGQRDNADRLVRDLRSRGFEAFVSPVSRPGNTLYRVRVGPEHDRDAAEQLARRLAAAGHRGPVVSM